MTSESHRYLLLLYVQIRKMQAEQSSEAEVFETSDVDEEEVVKKQPESEVAQGDDRVETTSVAPEDAFEKFSGKTYAVLPSGSLTLRCHA